MLLDTNVIIYAGGQHAVVIERFLAAHAPSVSIVSYIEAFGFPGITATEDARLRGFFSAAVIVPLTDDVVEQAVLLRRQRRMKLGDCIIAATALVYGRTLATRNTNDFRWIPGLRLHDPLAGVS